MKNIYFLLFLICCLSCKTKSGIPASCDTVGTVKDFTGLDGCGLLIELENGDLLNPVKMKPGFGLKDKQTISFSYKKLDDMAGICMREKAMVEVTCIHEMGKTPVGAGTCVDTNNPFEIDWMDHAIDLHNPNQILKYQSSNEWLYLFRSIPTSFLYNCKGKLICETKSDHDKCQAQHLADLGQGRIIWQGEGVWD